jgi:DNA polymerase V
MNKVVIYVNNSPAATEKTALLGRAAGAGGEDVPQRTVPLALGRVPAGFPSPADDYVEYGLDLNEYLVANPPATFMVRVGGDSMIDAGIHEGDVLVVDRSREPLHGRIVVAVLDGEFTVKRLLVCDGRYVLAPENASYDPIRIREGQDLTVWGVVTGVVRRY